MDFERELGRGANDCCVYAREVLTRSLCGIIRLLRESLALPLEARGHGDCERRAEPAQRLGCCQVAIARRHWQCLGNARLPCRDRRAIPLIAFVPRRLHRNGRDDSENRRVRPLYGDGGSHGRRLAHSCAWRHECRFYVFFLSASVLQGRRRRALVPRHKPRPPLPAHSVADAHPPYVTYFRSLALSTVR